jgi:cold shock CspA family protein
MTDELRQGHVSAWVEQKGFGFLTTGTGPKDFTRYFFHAREYSGPTPEPGMLVEFSVKPYLEGPCPTAIKVKAVKQ